MKMAESSQEQFFSQGEGDDWYRRNAEMIGKKPVNPVLQAILSIGALENVRSACDLGCANGWRLADVAKHLPHARELAGVDVSQEAVEDGARAYPNLKFVKGALSDIPLRRRFDLVIVAFVLHWIDRGLLSKTISEIDRIVENGGFLVIADFLPNYPVKRPYHHRPEAQVFTYKQDYAAAFTGLGLYRQMFRATFDHETGYVTERPFFLAPVAHQDRCAVTILHKDPAMYASV
jgi:SAM-dependent methyltransferase